eukprot:TRINITY_DN82652_c0_g1_i1.p1 TRINITY_DN82652_c0_g1~~TRINITY_DN82652_c0_g1_i1.p1  ORF type:complete len:856 (+),score=235.40 TRINITY_DN82652_c0_g1_i1:164-2731(+)
MFSNDDDDEENEGIEAGVAGITSVVVAKQRIVALLNEQQRKEDYQKRLVRKLQKLDADLAARREDVELQYRQLQTERSKESEQAKSDQREQSNKARMQEERLRDQLSDVLYRKPPSAPGDKSSQEFELDTVLVSFAMPNENVRYNLSFRVDQDTTVLELRNNVCKYWGVEYDDFILMTMANSKCQGDLKVRECFRHGEIAQLKLEQKSLENELVTEAELKAIQPKTSKKRKGRARKSAVSFNSDGVDRIQKFTDNYQSQLKKMGGIYFLLKVKDTKPSEHCSKIKLRDFVVFTIFAVLTFTTYQNRRPSGQGYWFTQGIEESFMINTPLPAIDDTTSYWDEVPKFKEVQTVHDVWLWLNNTLPAVLWNASGQGSSLPSYNRMLGLLAIRVQSAKKNLRNGTMDRTIHCPGENQKALVQKFDIAFCDYIMADVGEGQQETANLSEVKMYWNALSEMNQTDVKFRGPALPWEWKSAEENQKQGIAGVDGTLNNYDASGYLLDYRLDVEDMVPELPKYRQDLTFLRSAQWISTQTRLVSLSLSLYNFDYDMWAACEFLFEISPGGTVVTSHYIRPFRPNTQETFLELQDGYLDWVRLVICIYIAVFVGMAERRHKTKNHKAGILYHFSLNGITDFGMVVSFVTIFIWRSAEFHIKKTSNIMETIVDVDNTRGYYATTRTAQNYNSLFIIEGILFAFIMYRMLSLFRLNHKVYLLWHTIGSALKAYVYMCFMFLPTFLGFVFSANAVWGKYIEGYNSMSKTILRVYQLVEGHFDIEGLVAFDMVSATVYMLAFYAFVKFLLLNIFVTILVDAYYVVKVTSNKTGMEHWNAQRWRDWAIPGLLKDVASALVLKNSASEGG